MKTNAAPIAIISASSRSIAAVEPSKSWSKPAWRPALMFWIRVNMTTPNPKKLDRTAPIAASSDNLVRDFRKLTANRPSAALIAEPSNKPSNARPVPPKATITINPPQRPGRVAWLIASDSKARLRRNINVPVTPAAMPKTPAPNMTKATL